MICADSPIDQYVMQNLEIKLSPVKFQRIDASVDDHLVDKTRESESTNLAQIIGEKLADQNVEVVAKSLSNDSLPGFIMIDENQRRMRDYMLQMDPNDSMKASLFGKNTFVINTNNHLIQAIQKLNDKNPELAKDLVLQTYELSLLSQHEMRPNLLNEFILRSTRVLSTLAEQITEKD